MSDLKEPRVSDINPTVSIVLIFIVIVITGYGLVGQYAGLALASLFYEGDLPKEILKTSPDPVIFFPVMIMLGVTSLVGLIIIPLVYIRFIEKKPIAPFFKKEKNLLLLLGIIPLIGLCFYIAISPVVQWNMNLEFSGAMEEFGTWARKTEDQLMGVTKLITNFKSPFEFMLGVVVIGLLPGIGEELVFRGMIQNELYRASKNIHISIWVGAILFSTIHMQFFGFVPRMLLGALFGYLYHWSGNLLVPMIAHFFHNAFTVTMIYLYNIGSTEVNVEREESAPIPLVAVCVVLTFGLLYYFRRQYRSQESLPS